MKVRGISVVYSMSVSREEEFSEDQSATAVVNGFIGLTSFSGTRASSSKGVVKGFRTFEDALA